MTQMRAPRHRRRVDSEPPQVGWHSGRQSSYRPISRQPGKSSLEESRARTAERAPARCVELDVAAARAATAQREVLLRVFGHINGGPRLVPPPHEETIGVARLAPVVGHNAEIDVTKQVRRGCATNEAGAVRPPRLGVSAIVTAPDVRRDARRSNVEAVALVGVVEMSPGHRAILASA